jgi:hypothetical protein
MSREGGATIAIDATGAGVRTVMLADPLRPPDVARIVACPAATAVTTPAEDTEATPGAVDDQSGSPMPNAAPYWSTPAADAVVD